MKLYSIRTEDGKQYQIEYMHPDFGVMILKTDDFKGHSYPDLDELEDDLLSLVKLKLESIICVEPDTGNVLIIPEKVISESVMRIKEL